MCFGERVPCIPSWPPTQSEAEDKFELLLSCLSFQMLGLQLCITMSCYVVLEIKSRVSHTPGKYSANGAMSPTP